MNFKCPDFEDGEKVELVAEIEVLTKEEDGSPKEFTMKVGDQGTIVPGGSEYPDCVKIEFNRWGMWDVYVKDIIKAQEPKDDELVEMIELSKEGAAFFNEIVDKKECPNCHMPRNGRLDTCPLCSLTEEEVDVFVEGVDQARITAFTIRCKQKLAEKTR